MREVSGKNRHAPVLSPQMGPCRPELITGGKRILHTARAPDESTFSHGNRDHFSELVSHSWIVDA